MSGLIEAVVVTTLEELVTEESWKGDFPGGPVVKTPLSQCRGTGFDPWEGNQSSAGKESTCNACRRPRFDSWVGKIPWRRARLPTPVFLGFPGGSVGKESALGEGGEIPWRRAWQPSPALLPGESPWTEKPGGLRSMSYKESDVTERLSTAQELDPVGCN